MDVISPTAGIPYPVRFAEHELREREGRIDMGDVHNLGNVEPERPEPDPPVIERPGWLKSKEVKEGRPRDDA